MNCYCPVSFRFLEEMLLKISTFLSHPCKEVHSGHKVLASKEPWFHILVVFQGLQQILTVFLLDITYFIFIFFYLTFFFRLTLKRLKSGSAFLPKAQSTMQLFLAYAAYMASVYGTEENTCSYRRAPASLILSWFPLLCAPVMLQNVWETLWVEHKVYRESTVRNYPITVVYPLSEHENCVPELSMLNWLITGKEILTFFSIWVYFH